MDNLTELQRELCRLRDVWAPHPSERKAGNSHVCRAKQITYDHAADLVAELIATVKAARDLAHAEPTDECDKLFWRGRANVYKSILGEEDNDNG
jgi:hypothetical protein